MKKLSVILAVLVAFALVGCASGPSGGASGDGAPPFIVDLSTLTQVQLLKSGDAIGEELGNSLRNANPFTQNYDDLLFLFPEFDVDISQYSRFTTTCKYFNADGGEIGQGDGNAMVVLVYDVHGDKRGPAMGAGPNTPVKEFNVGGFSGAVSSDRGVRVALRQAPQGILFQNSNANVRFIEVTSIVFHNGDYSTK